MYLFFITILLIFFIVVSLSYKEGLDTIEVSKSIEDKNSNLNIISERVWQNRKEFYILVDEIYRKIGERKEITNDVNTLISLRENIVKQISGISGAEHIKHTLDQQVALILTSVENENKLLNKKKVNLYGGWDKDKKKYVRGVINESNLYDAANKTKTLSTRSYMIKGYILMPILILVSGALLYVFLKILKK